MDVFMIPPGVEVFSILFSFFPRSRVERVWKQGSEAITIRRMAKEQRENKNELEKSFCTANE